MSPWEKAYDITATRLLSLCPVQCLPISLVISAPSTDVEVLLREIRDGVQASE